MNTIQPEPVNAVLRTSFSVTGEIGGTRFQEGVSNGVAAFHRALHRVYDTREGRPFLWFRTIVFGETVLIVAVVLLAIILDRITESFGTPQTNKRGLFAWFSGKLQRQST